MLFDLILSWIGNNLGGFFSKAVDGVVAVKKAEITADTADDKLSAGLASQDIAARQQINQAEISSNLLRWPRLLFEIGAALYFIESVVIDKALASLLAKFGVHVDWSTDPITGPMGTVYMLIVGSIFGASIADRVVSKLTGR